MTLAQVIRFKELAIKWRKWYLAAKLRDQEYALKYPWEKE